MRLWRRRRRTHPGVIVTVRHQHDPDHAAPLVRATSDDLYDMARWAPGGCEEWILGPVVVELEPVTLDKHGLIVARGVAPPGYPPG